MKCEILIKYDEDVCTDNTCVLFCYQTFKILGSFLCDWVVHIELQKRLGKDKTRCVFSFEIIGNWKKL